MTVRNLTYAAVIAALYVVLTMMPGLAEIGYGAVQFRVSEALCALALITPYAGIGLSVGCLISNIISPFGVIDMIFGTLATVIAVFAMYRLCGKPLLALAIPAIANGLIVGALITFGETNGFPMGVLLFNMGTVALGELVVCYLLGWPLYKITQRTGMLK